VRSQQETCYAIFLSTSYIGTDSLA
jgi:hypothetical protein